MDRTITYVPSVRRLAMTALGAALFSLTLVGCGGSNTPPDTTCTQAQVDTLFNTTYGCSVTGCHDAAATGGNFSMTAGYENRLVGVMPKGGGTTASKCGGMNQVYLKAGSDPATGLFIDKLSAAPPCGDQMPMVGKKLSPSDLACVKSWATGLTKNAAAGTGG